jgi:glucose/arabinose dehydrogenase
MRNETPPRRGPYIAYVSALAALMFLLGACPRCYAEDDPVTLRTAPVVIARGFDELVDVAVAPDASDTIFLAERGGLVKAVAKGKELDDAILDIEEILSSKPGVGLESVAIAPSMQALFFSYTDKNGDTVLASTRLPQETETATPDDMTVLLKIVQLQPQHPRSIIRFGQDGYLYMITGALDHQTESQRLKDLRGCILRLDVSDPTKYHIPSDNPLYGSPAHPHEAWAHGIKGSWGLVMDSALPQPLLGLTQHNAATILSPLQKGRDYLQPCPSASCIRTLPRVTGDHTNRWIGIIRYQGSQLKALKDQLLVAEEALGVFALTSTNGGAEAPVSVASVPSGKIVILTTTPQGEPLLATDKGELLTLRPL